MEIRYKVESKSLAILEIIVTHIYFTRKIKINMKLPAFSAGRGQREREMEERHYN